MEGISGLQNHGAGYFTPAAKVSSCVERTNNVALDCLEERASFTGLHLPLQPLSGPNLWSTFS